MLNGNGPPLKLVVAGGSLGGLFNAIALRSLGCEVEVFEKSSGLMRDRGAGIVFQQEVAEFLTRFEVAPLESVVVPVQTRRYLGHDGAVLQKGPMPQAMTSWDMLYRKLRVSFGDDHYHVGVRLVGFETANDKVTARFDDGREEGEDHGESTSTHSRTPNSAQGRITDPSHLPGNRPAGLVASVLGTPRLRRVGLHVLTSTVTVTTEALENGLYDKVGLTKRSLVFKCMRVAPSHREITAIPLPEGRSE
jgi:hypothetical protein